MNHSGLSPAKRIGSFQGMSNKQPYTAPAFQLNAFHCPLCGTYAHQVWGPAYWKAEGAGGNVSQMAILWVAHCFACGKRSVWHDTRMIFPAVVAAPAPSADMPPEVRPDYEEAGLIASASPRGAAALLRLSLQKLCLHLGGTGDNLNADIGALVKKGLPSKVQQALDALRVIGNNAVHPGQIDLKDDSETVNALFGLVNFVVEKMITEEKEIDELYGMLPAGAIEAIKKRDGKS
jgi:hypothetical protein